MWVEEFPFFSSSEEEDKTALVVADSNTELMKCTFYKCRPVSKTIHPFMKLMT